MSTHQMAIEIEGLQLVVADIEAARATGIKAGAVAWGYTTATRLAAEKPDHLFETPVDILTVFDAV